jgi:uncharacterized protein DUF4231
MSGFNYTLIVQHTFGDTVSNDLEAEKRENAQRIDFQQTQLRELRVAQRLRIMWLSASLLVALFLGWAMIVGVWTHYRGPFSVLGFAAASVSTLLAGWNILKARPGIAEEAYKAIVLEAERVNLAAIEAADPIAALRVYRVSALNDVEQYRRVARRNRRFSNYLQWIIIVGSVVATSLTSASTTIAGTTPPVRWGAAIMSATVSIAAGLVGYFKFRERGFNEQQTADAIEKHYKAAGWASASIETWMSGRRSAGSLTKWKS